MFYAINYLVAYPILEDGSLALPGGVEISMQTVGKSLEELGKKLVD